MLGMLSEDTVLFFVRLFAHLRKLVRLGRSTRIGFVVLGSMTLLSVLQAWSVVPKTVSIEAKFGLANYLPISFWATFVGALVGLWLVRDCRRDLEYLVALLMLTTIMWGIPTLRWNCPFIRTPSGTCPMRNG